MIPNKGDNLFGPANHEFYMFFTQLTPGSVFFIVPVGYMICYYIFKFLKRRCNLEKTQQQNLRDNFLNLDDEKLASHDVAAKDSLKHSSQYLPPLFTALRTFQKSAMLKEEKVCRQKLGMNRHSDETYQKLEHEAE